MLWTPLYVHSCWGARVSDHWIGIWTVTMELNSKRTVIQGCYLTTQALWPSLPMPTILLLYPSVVLLLAHYQVLCYCSLTKPDPCKARPLYKCKSLVSQDYSYWVVFVDKDVTAEIGAQSQLLHFALHVCAPWSSVTNSLTTLVATFLNSSKCAPHAWYYS